MNLQEHNNKLEYEVPDLLRANSYLSWFLFSNLKVSHVFFFSLGPLVGKVKEHHVETIVDSLCSNMLSDHEQLRDISSIGEYAQGLVSFCCFCCFMFKTLSLWGRSEKRYVVLG